MEFSTAPVSGCRPQALLFAGVLMLLASPMLPTVASDVPAMEHYVIFKAPGAAYTENITWPVEGRVDVTYAKAKAFCETRSAFLPVLKGNDSLRTPALITTLYNLITNTTRTTGGSPTIWVNGGSAAKFATSKTVVFEAQSTAMFVCVPALYTVQNVTTPEDEVMYVGHLTLATNKPVSAATSRNTCPSLAPPLPGWGHFTGWAKQIPLWLYPAYEEYMKAIGQSMLRAFSLSTVNIFVDGHMYVTVSVDPSTNITTISNHTIGKTNTRAYVVCWIVRVLERANCTSSSYPNGRIAPDGLVTCNKGYFYVNQLNGEGSDPGFCAKDQRRILTGVCKAPVYSVNKLPPQSSQWVWLANLTAMDREEAEATCIHFPSATDQGWQESYQYYKAIAGKMLRENRKLSNATFWAKCNFQLYAPTCSVVASLDEKTGQVTVSKPRLLPWGTTKKAFAICSSSIDQKNSACPSTIPHGKILANGAVACDTAFYHSPAPAGTPAYCDKSGVFGVGTCGGALCGDPGTPLNGVRIGSSFTAGDTVGFQCNENYALNGAAAIYCLAFGSWNSQRPTCIPVGQCVDPGTPANGVRKGTSFRVGDSVSYQCIGNYLLSGHTVLNCLPSTSWDSERPTCVPNVEHKCIGSALLPLLKEGQSIEDGFVLSKVYSEGYIVQGNRGKDGKPLFFQCHGGHWVQLAEGDA